MRAETQPSLPPLRVIGSYMLGEELGRGAMSVVYRATHNGKSFAIKVMAGRGDPVETRLSFRREAAAIARLDHPSLVRVLEVGETDGRPYLVMDVAEGEGLDKRLTGSPLADDQVIALARSIASALAEVHRHGLVHRDIKPANIVVAANGDARLIDFGLVSPASETDAVVGTLNYAAPEQMGILNRRVGPASDLFALGVTMFEALTGRLPLGGDNETEFLHQLATTQAPDLRDVRPGTRPALAAIISRLLRKDPDDRYQSAQGLLADLNVIDHLDQVLRSGRQVTLGANDRTVALDQDLPLVGREAEVETLNRAFEACKRGQFAAVLIEGEGGSGKTRLARELTRTAEGQGALILSGKCNELETVPFGPLREAVDQLAARIQRMPDEERLVATDRIREAAGEFGPLVRRLSPSLARLLGPMPEIRPLEPNAEQHRFYEALAGFFRGLASNKQPLVMLVDDAQWLDEGSLRVLARLGSEPSGTPFLLIATSRDGEDNQAALTRVANVLAGRLAGRITLAPLTFDAIDALITLSLGGSPLDRPTVQRLASLTHGNPFAIGQYLRTLLDQGVLRPHGRQWRADMERLEEAHLPNDVIELVVRRLNGLGEQAARVATTAAVIGTRFRADLLGEVLADQAVDLGRTLEELVASGLLERTWGDHFAFVHDRVRESALERLSSEEVRDLHQKAAECLDARPERTTSELFALARHYAQGHTDQNPGRAAEINLEAGLRALEDHANEEAFELLERAYGLLGEASIDKPTRLLEGLGRACAMTGRLDLAFKHLETALSRARDKQDRFRLQHLLTLTYASQGRNDEALAGVFKTFDVVGRPFPKWRVIQIVTLIGYWIAALVLRWTGFRYGKASGANRERRTVLSQLHYTGSMVSLFQGDPILMLQFVVRDFFNVHFLGPTPETAVASSLYGAVMGMFSFESVMKRYTRLGVQTAEQLGDRAALAVAHAYEAVGHKWAGDLVRGNSMLEPALDELHRYTPGSWYQAMMIAEQAYSYLHAGHTLSAVAHCRKNLGQLERTNNLMYRWNTLSVLYAETMLTGDSGSASELLSRLEPAYEPLRNTLYVKLAKVIADLEVMTDQEEVGPDVDRTIELFKSLASEDYYSNAGRMLAGYARLHQFEKATETDRKAARKRLSRAIWALRIRALVPVFKCHPLIWRAALARTDGRFDKADKLLAKAQRLATQCESHRGLFHVALERARIAKAQGDPVATFHAEQAVRVAMSEQWRRRARRVRVEFELATHKDNNAANTTRLAAVANARSVEQNQRYAQALLQVSLASVSSLDVKSLAKNALTEVSKVLGAERALFFTVDEETREPTLEATIGPQTQSISQSVVRRIIETKTPLVLTGTDDGEALASESILTYGLRSILAAPVMLRDRLLGVVYLDSRLAKGIFTPDDVGLLLGVSNHIAIALETARVARSEAERLAMARDLELVGAMQTLFMPKLARFSLPGMSGVGFYQPATQCGGDWWWYEAQPDGTMLLLLGDVSGHGAGAAMITSAVAGSFLTLRQYLGLHDPEAVLAELGRRLFAFGNSTMTMSIVRIDPRRRELTLWNAASPGILAINNGVSRLVVAPGRVLGDAGPLDIGRTSMRFEPGDRLLISTDGLYELKDTHGRQLGPRRVSALMQRLAAVPLDEIPRHLGAEIRETLKDRSQEDDITCVVLEISDASRSPRTAGPDNP